MVSTLESLNFASWTIQIPWAQKCIIPPPPYILSIAFCVFCSLAWSACICPYILLLFGTAVSRLNICTEHSHDNYFLWYFPAFNNSFVDIFGGCRHPSEACTVFITAPNISPHHHLSSLLTYNIVLCDVVSCLVQQYTVTSAFLPKVMRNSKRIAVSFLLEEGILVTFSIFSIFAFLANLKIEHSKSEDLIFRE